MASNRIKGITIEIDGDTSGLNHALSSVDKSLKTTQSNLKDINKLLKLDPKNTELLAQKQENLTKAIGDTKKRLDTLKQTMAQLNEKHGYGATEEQRNLAREIIATEQNLKSLESEMRNFGSVAKQQLQSIGGDLKKMGDDITKVGEGLSLKLTAPILALGTMGVTYNAQIEQYRTMFTTLTGSAEEADRIIKQLQEDAQKSPFDSESLIKANQYLISAGVDAESSREAILNLGNAIAATGGGSAELERMAQNLQQIKNVGKASAQDIKQFANAGINIYGLLAEATGKSIEKVKDMDVSYELLTEALAKASDEGGKYAGAMEAQGQTLNGSLNATKESIQMLLGEITESAMPIIVEVLNKIRDVISWISLLDGETKKTILIIASVLAVIGPALVMLGTVISTIGGIVSAIGLLFTPMGAIVTAIGLIVAAIVWLNENMELVKTVASDVWGKVKTDFQAIVDFFKEKIDYLVEKFVAFKDAIINAFSFDNITSKISGLFSGVGGIFGSSGFMSGGFASGGMMSGTLTLNNTFNITTSQINRQTAIHLADMITDRVNENLGRMI